MASFPSVKQLLDGLQCPVYAARFLKLKAGSVIKKHRDNELAFEKGEARLHFPVITNPLVEFCSEDERIPLLEGECWYLNANLPHSVANHGETDRVHLVVDCEVNNWLTGLMKAATQVAKKNTVDTSQTLNTIAMLRLQNTTTANDLANALEKELEAAEDEN